VHVHATATAGRVALAERSRKIFQTKWAEVLQSQPTRLLSGEDLARIRDHMCGSRTLILIGDSVVEAEVAALVEKAGHSAVANPRDRFTVALSPRSFVEGLRRQWSRAGLEIIQGPLSTIDPQRVATATKIERLGV
jgi:hypothetical protein